MTSNPTLDRHSEIGTIQLGKIVRVTDPCYNKSVGAAYTFDTRPGKYIASMLKQKVPGWGPSICELAIVHTDVELEKLEWECTTESLERKANIIQAGVDSGQCGFADDARYPDGDTGDYCDETSFYRKVCDQTQVSDVAVLPWAAFTTSGFGDGSYVVLTARVKGIAVAWALIFVDADEL